MTRLNRREFIGVAGVAALSPAPTILIRRAVNPVVISSANVIASRTAATRWSRCTTTTVLRLVQGRSILPT